MVRWIFLLGAYLAIGAAGCAGEKAGDPHDQFLQNTGKAPLSCVEMVEGKVYAGSCNSGLEGAQLAYCCRDPAFVPSSAT